MLYRKLLRPRRLQFSQRFFEVVGQRRFEVLPLFGARMMESKFPRVQHLAGKNFGQLRCINFVAQNGMVKVMQMNANLMRPSAVQPAFDQTHFFAGANNSIFRLCAASARFRHRHPLSMHGMTADFRFDCA